MSGQSRARVAKTEAADPSVSLDLLIRAFYKLGGKRGELAELVET